MARLSASDRADAVTLIPAPDGVNPDTGEPDDKDFEDGFTDWRESLKVDSKAGTVTAYRIPINERGELASGFKGQTDIGSWPHDLYTLDELIDKIRAEYMGADTRWAVRFVGRVRGERGVRFNQIMMIGKSHQPSIAPAKESTSDLLRAVSEMNSQNQAMFARLMETRPVNTGPGFDMAGAATLITAIGGAVSPIIAAMITKPAVPAIAPDFNGIAGLLTAVGKFAGRGGSAPAASDMGEWAEILKAVAPMATPFIQGLMAARAAQTAAPPAVPALPAPGTVPTPPPAPAQPAPGAVAQRPTPPPPPAVVAGFDTPTPPPPAAPSPEQQAVLAQLMKLKPEIDGLVQVAGVPGNDPVNVANLYFEQGMLTASDDNYAAICDFIADPNWKTKAAMVNAQISDPNLATFFEAFITQVRARILTEDAEANTPTA